MVLVFPPALTWSVDARSRSRRPRSVRRSGGIPRLAKGAVPLPLSRLPEPVSSLGPPRSDSAATSCAHGAMGPPAVHRQGKVARRKTGPAGQLVPRYAALVQQLPYRRGVEQDSERKGAVSHFLCSFHRRFRPSRTERRRGVAGVGLGEGAVAGVAAAPLGCPYVLAFFCPRPAGLPGAGGTVFPSRSPWGRSLVPVIALAQARKAPGPARPVLPASGVHRQHPHHVELPLGQAQRSQPASPARRIPTTSPLSPTPRCRPQPRSSRDHSISERDAPCYFPRSLLHPSEGISRRLCRAS